MDLTTGLSLFGTCVTALSGLIWAVRQEGRINGHDQRFEQLEKADEAQEKVLDERHSDLKERLVRIEQKLDRSNGYGKSTGA